MLTKCLPGLRPVRQGLQVKVLLKRSMTDACGQHTDIYRQHMLTEVNSALAEPCPPEVGTSRYVYFKSTNKKI